ncbi:Uncharacterised protein [Bordetella pertussis]|nr:Uncharacterised protein [Bordetella pertussis]
MELQRGQQDADIQAAHRCPVPRRQQVRRRRGARQPGARHDAAGQHAQGRTGLGRENRGARSRHPGADAQAPRRHLAGAVVRPRRHDALAQGLRGRRGRGGPQADLLGPLQVRRTGAERPHRAAEVRPVLRRQGLPLRQAGIPAHSGHHGAPVQSARRRAGHPGAHEPLGRAAGQERRQRAVHAGVGSGLPGGLLQYGQRQARRDQSVQGQAGAPGAGLVDRPRHHQRSGRRRHLRPGQPAVPAGQPLSQRQVPGAQARCRARPRAAQGSRPAEGQGRVRLRQQHHDLGHRRKDPGHGGRGRLRAEPAAHRIRRHAQRGAGRQLRDDHARLVGPGRPGRQHLPVRDLQGRAERRPLLQCRGRQAAGRGAHRARPGQAQGDLRPGPGAAAGRHAPKSRTRTAWCA